MDDIVDVPEYFLCPISLQIMSDPVTTITGITYERSSIEHWLKTTTTADDDSVCPVTKQPLPKSAGLTPNHTLRRLISSWSTSNRRVDSPKPEFNPSRIARLILDINENKIWSVESLKELETLAAESERNRKWMVESGGVDCVVRVINRCYRDKRIDGLYRAMKILNRIHEIGSRLVNRDLIDSISWILEDEAVCDLTLRSQAALSARIIFEVGDWTNRDGSGVKFITGLIRLLTEPNCDSSTIKNALRVLIKLSRCGKNRQAMIENNVVFSMIEVELRTLKDKRLSELVFCLLSLLCSCADGRAQLLGHAAGIAMVTERLLRVSAEVDDRAVHVLSVLARFSATGETLMEMLRVGTVSKLCMVLQTDAPKYSKDRVREMLRMHSNVWKSPCVQVYLLTRYPTLQF
ncbi:hypothetical protein Droror1_Dr00004158 [Drosera rotundifolia]